KTRSAPRPVEWSRFLVTAAARSAEPHVSGPSELRLGTRGSQLALWQAAAVASRIEKSGGPQCRLVIIKTSGDRLQNAPLSEVGGKRLFVKEIEDALLKREIDLAVHSIKDMPAVLPEGLVIAAVLPREDPLDAIVLPVRLKADTTYGDRGRDPADTITNGDRGRDPADTITHGGEGRA